MANPRPIGGGLQGLQQAYGSLAQSNAIVRAAEEREAARNRSQQGSQLRMLGAGAGAVIGGVYGGPAGAAAGMSIGSAAGGMVSAAQGNEQYPVGEVVQAGQTYASYDEGQQRKNAQEKKQADELAVQEAQLGKAKNGTDMYTKDISGLYSEGYLSEDDKNRDIEKNRQEYLVRPEGMTDEQYLGKQQKLDEEFEGLKSSKVLTSEDIAINNLIEGEFGEIKTSLGAMKETGDFKGYNEEIKNRRSNLALFRMQLSKTPDDKKLTLAESAKSAGFGAKPVNFQKAIGYDPTSNRAKYSVLEFDDDGFVKYADSGIAVNEVVADSLRVMDEENRFVMPMTQAKPYVQSDAKRRKEFLKEKSDTASKRAIITSDRGGGEDGALGKNVNMINVTGADALSGRLTELSKKKIGGFIVGNTNFTAEEIGEAAAKDSTVPAVQKSAVSYRAERNLEIDRRLKKVAESKDFSPGDVEKKRESLQKQSDLVTEYEEHFLDNLIGDLEGIVLPKKGLNSFNTPEEARAQALKDIDTARLKRTEAILKQDTQGLLEKGGDGYSITGIEDALESISLAFTPRAKTKREWLQNQLKEKMAGLASDEKTAEDKKNLEIKLGKEHASQKARFTLVRDKMNIINAAFEKGEENGGVADMALIFAYMKMLDPTSVVRESEYASAKNAPGTAAWISNLWNKAKKMQDWVIPQGDLFTPETRAKFYDQAKAMWDGYQGSLSELNGRYIRMSNKYGLDYKMILEKDDWPAGARQNNNGGQGAQGQGESSGITDILLNGVDL